MLSMLISRYNDYKANSAIRRWQISPDQQAAMWAIIIGMDETSRNLVRSHLDHHKWEESGHLTRIILLNMLICACHAYFSL